MGKLALFGALAGAGQTVAKLGDEKAKAQAAQAQGEIAEAREKRIAEFNSGLRTKEQGVQNQFTADQASTQRDFQKTLSREEQAAQTDRSNTELSSRESQSEAERAARAAEGAADRENRIKVAEIGAGARGAGKDDNRFFIEKQKRTKPAPLGSDGKPVGLGEEYEATVVTDKKTGETFEQKGDKFVPQGNDLTQFPAPKQSAIDKLMSGEVTPGDFLARAGYLPAVYFATQRK